jgi:hypothetical protein
MFVAARGARSLVDDVDKTNRLFEALLVLYSYEKLLGSSQKILPPNDVRGIVCKVLIDEVERQSLARSSRRGYKRLSPYLV